MFFRQILLFVIFFVFSQRVLGSTTHAPRPVAKADWLGLVPLQADEAPGKNLSPREQEAEEKLTQGRKGFWWGVGGLAASVLFDQMHLVPARTIGYTIMGLGWLTWLGNYGAASHNLDSPNGTEDLTVDSTRKLYRASTQGAIGEASNLFLIPNGVYIHPIYNDVNGGTDKLLTGSAKMGLLLGDDQFSIETIAYWRLLTPSFRHEFGLPDAPQPVGRYADWQEIKTSIARVSELGNFKIKKQVTVGYSDVGPKGGKEFHQTIHRITRNSLDNLEYTNQPEGKFWTFSEELGVIVKNCWHRSNCITESYAVDATQGKFMREAGIRYNLLQVVSKKWWENAIELRLIRQLGSDVYSGIRPWRYEGAIGARILNVITPTVKFVSPYLVGDDIGQTYFDLIHFNYEF